MSVAWYGGEDRILLTVRSTAASVVGLATLSRKRRAIRRGK